MNIANIQHSSTTDNKMSDSVFNRITEIAHQQAGIVLTRSKESMVKSRLVRRLRALKMESYELYLDHLEAGQDKGEMSQFISALTTNVSHFFREEHHFEYLQETILPILSKKLKAGEKVRIWSAGCSNGQEPYSIAMSLLKYDPQIAQYDVKILATDIDSEVLQCASKGEYAGSMTTGITDEMKAKFFSIRVENDEEFLTIHQSVKDLISFKRLNLHAEWPMKGHFDLIFCRNVVIYFDQATQNALYQRYADILSEEGWLMLGHSERLGEDSDHLFKSVGVTTYQPLKNH